MGHTHNVYDSDTHFSINPITRMIKNESSRKVMLVQHDHNSERFTFELPRQIEGHDMSLCNLVEVHYLNVDAATEEKKSGLYTVTDLQVDGEKVVCSWLISQNATSLVGSLNFLLRFACVTGDVVDYAWNTAIFTGISISDGINAGEMFENDYVDVIAQWKAEITQQITKDVNSNVTEWAETESGKLRGLLFEETTKTNTAIAVERARIDQMVSKPTANDAEVVDIRVGADGKTRSSAGAAVREQFLSTMRSSGKFLDANNYTALFDDANNATANTSYFISSSITADMVANLPVYKELGMIMTFNYSSINDHGKTQFYVNAEGDFYWRFEQGSNADYYWTDWRCPVTVDGLIGFVRPSNAQVGTNNYLALLPDANNAEHGHVYFINHDITAEMVPNLPEYGYNGLLVTLGFNKTVSHGKFQIFVNGNGYHFRMEEGHGENFKWYGWNGRLTTTDVISTVEANMDHLLSKAITNKNTCSIFARVCCCGDSYTSGHISIDNTPATVTNEHFAWPSFMARLTGNEYI